MSGQTAAGQGASGQGAEQGRGWGRPDVPAASGGAAAFRVDPLPPNPLQPAPVQTGAAAAPSPLPPNPLHPTPVQTGPLPPNPLQPTPVQMPPGGRRGRDDEAAESYPAGRRSAAEVDEVVTGRRGRGATVPDEAFPDRDEELAGRIAGLAGLDAPGGARAADLQELQGVRDGRQGEQGSPRATDLDEAERGRRAAEEAPNGRRAAEEAPGGRRAAEEAPGGRRVVRDADGGEHGQPLRPGDLDQSPISFWDEAASEQFRAEWHEVKAQFVDDPVAALTRAHDLLTEAVHELTESMLAERDQLDPLRDTSSPDTESMRMAMRGYREFLDRILGL
ncbi:hypothetical protein [Pseudosporangium ferrugineum]|uniref:Uncharacterized protein n=1 Tax=Pseudosporangium ferrugineum TaxID=439699 RepID=A0A2T0S9F4_9ACTN|nr:hypothetical protein [Pseudosporangium ferrugineum]PRY30026.1 hypothetical protein CLV70_105195 [Pseudosporangium ferrugineum]